ncbi:MAG: adenine nucleotide alpha hydrolase [Bacteroidetes bacterium]|nr:adenine nucleotide alpha hydrolase [Bacteroidota bacterium]
MKKVWLSWSTGKDSAWTLHALTKDPEFEVAGLFTTVTEEFDRVSVHGVRTSLLDAQSKRLDIPIHRVILPWPCSNKLYQNAMDHVWQAASDHGIEMIAFGDLFLEDVRQYRLDILKNTGLQPIFPIWGQPTSSLADAMISSGLRAIVTCVDTRQLPAEYSGQNYDRDFLNQLPTSVDPCGENGEFHTFVYSFPMFSQPIDMKIGEVVNREGFVYTDVMSRLDDPDDLIVHSTNLILNR